ncbi:MAG: methyltransferase [Anaerolineae bacterium CG2_30_64_16]|nr:MAG: methyltransferase [Anaerolineae bacterium CG2_30_64_16]
MDHLESIYNAVLDGDAASAQAGVKAALAANLPADVILKNGLIAAMSEVGRLFEENEYFVPEMLVSARAMQSGLALLKPYLAEAGAEPAGKIIMGTVKGDLHDIGKNLVSMMLEGAGFEIIDLGSDVAPQAFVKAVQERQAQVIGMSALLTTTMPSMSATIKALEEAGMRDKVKIMIGGAPVTDGFAKQIGADGFSPDASSAVRLAKSLLG